MKIEIDHSSLADAIAQKTIEMLKPIIQCRGKEEDIIFDVRSLAQYLRVSSQWVYERKQFKEIPFYRIGGHLRFSKKKIDQWLLQNHTPHLQAQ